MHARRFLPAVNLLFLLILPTSVFAQSLPARIGHYARTHKRLLVADTLLFATWAADAASSVHAQKSGCCVEINPIVGKHPNELATWTYTMGFASLMVVGEHLIWWKGGQVDPYAAHILIWPGVLAFTIPEYFNIRDNTRYAGISYNTAANLSRARERLSH